MNRIRRHHSSETVAMNGSFGPAKVPLLLLEQMMPCLGFCLVAEMSCETQFKFKQTVFLHITLACYFAHRCSPCGPFLGIKSPLVG